MEKKLNKIVKVEWLDAVGGLKEDLSAISDKNPSDLLPMTITYGKYYKDDSNAIIILQEESDLTVDYTVIPKSLIIEIKVLK